MVKMDIIVYIRLKQIYAVATSARAMLLLRLLPLLLFSIPVFAHSICFFLLFLYFNRVLCKLWLAFMSCAHFRHSHKQKTSKITISYIVHNERQRIHSAHTLTAQQNKASKNRERRKNVSDVNSKRYMVPMACTFSPGYAGFDVPVLNSKYLAQKNHHNLNADDKNTCVCYRLAGVECECERAPSSLASI